MTWLYLVECEEQYSRYIGVIPGNKPDKASYENGWRDAARFLQSAPTEVAAPDREAVITECRRVVLEVSKDAHEAAKAKDATDYVAGYQDAVVDCDEELLALLKLTPAGYGPNAKECSGKIQDGGEPQDGGR